MPRPPDKQELRCRELAIAAPLLALAIALGVYPNAVFRYMRPSVDRTVEDLTNWGQSDGSATSEVEVASFVPGPAARVAP